MYSWLTCFGADRQSDTDRRRSAVQNESDKEFFCGCIRQYEGDLHAVAYSILRNETDTADVIQDAILKAYTKLDTLRNRDQFKPWILRIVHYTAITYLRGQHHTVELEEQGDLPCEDFSEDTDTKLTVWQYVQRLKHPYRMVIILFYYKNYSVRQIGKITSASEVTVRQQLARGRKLLAEMMDREDFYHGSN